VNHWSISMGRGCCGRKLGESWVPLRGLGWR
jgi:hypothetical protein